MPKRKGGELFVDRLGSWYTPPKIRKLAPEDKVYKMMAPRLAVNGDIGMDRLNEVMKKMPPVGHRSFEKGGRVKQPRRRLGGAVEQSAKDRLDELLSMLPPEARVNWDSPINKTRPDLNLISGGTWRNYVAEMKQQGKPTSDIGYRAYRLKKYLPIIPKTKKYQGVAGFFRGAVDAWISEGPKNLSDAFSVVGDIVPGAHEITDKIQDKLNPTHVPKSWELIGGPAGTAISKATEAAKGATGGRVRRRKKMGGGGTLADLLYEGNHGKISREEAERQAATANETKFDPSKHKEPSLAGFFHFVQEGSKPIIDAYDKYVAPVVSIAKFAAGVDPAKTLRALPQDTKFTANKGSGVIYPIPDMHMDPDLANLITTMKHAKSPFHKENAESLSNLSQHHSKLINNFRTKNRKLPGLNPRRKITKGGRTFTTMKNLLVSPQAAP